MPISTIDFKNYTFSDEPITTVHEKFNALFGTFDDTTISWVESNLNVTTNNRFALVLTYDTGVGYTGNVINKEQLSDMLNHTTVYLRALFNVAPFNVTPESRNYTKYYKADPNSNYTTLTVALSESINNSTLKNIGGRSFRISNQNLMTISPFTEYAIYDEYFFTIDINAPIFDNLESALNYLDNGVIDEHCLNGGGGANENEINTNKQYYITNQLKKNGTVLSFKNFNFAIVPDAKIYLSATTHESIGSSANMRLTITDKPFKYIDIDEHMTTWAESNVLTDKMQNYFYGEWTDFSTGDIYTVMLNTNIPIFAPEDAEKYERGEIGVDGSIGGGGVYNTSTIGDGLTSTDIETSSFDSSAGGSQIYFLSESQMRAVQNYLFDPDQTYIDSLLSGLALWGNNPISAVISAYFLPFSASLFYNIFLGGVKFGSHVATQIGAVTCASNGGKKVQIFSTSFERKYNDYRDFLYMDYEIYLPFVGKFIKLDPSKYLGKIVSCEMLFDAYTREIRYFLYANGIITDRIDTTVGTELALISTDNVNKAKADVNASLGMVGNAVSITSGLATGNASAVVGGITGAISNSLTSMTKPAESVTGGYSSALNSYDIRYPYLRITESMSLKPTNLNAQFNYPSYYIGVASNLRGYCELADIRLNSTATENEYNEIMSLLSKGVIF